MLAQLPWYQAYSLHTVMQISTPCASAALFSVTQNLTDLASKTVRLRYDPTQLPMDKIEALLDDAGYTVAK